MKRFDDDTDMGGMRDEFLTTHWSMIEDVTLSDEETHRALVSLLIEMYWKPVYSYLRRRGYGNEQAKDLTQGFFHEVVLGRKLIARADHTKGSFRSFLLVALNRYTNDVRDGQAAQKRIPRNKLVYLDQIDAPDLPDAVTDLGPEDSFNYIWISELLEQVLDEVRTTCCEGGMTVHWNVFHDRVLGPVIDNAAPPSMKEICDRYGIEDGIKASNMIITIKRRLQATIERKLRRSVVSESEIDDELGEIVQFLSAHRAG
jgi:DNA-directed RNA polymerase specialized sigma24 family protein